MKIIKEGRPQQGWAKEFECTGAGNGDGGCGAILLVEQQDIFMTSSSHYDGSVDHYKTFRCPACRVRTDIPDRVSITFPVRTSENINEGEK